MQIFIGKTYMFNNEVSNTNQLLVLGQFKDSYDVAIIADVDIQNDAGNEFVVCNVNIYSTLEIYETTSGKLIGNNFRERYEGIHLTPMTPTVTFGQVPIPLESNPTIVPDTYLMFGYKEGTMLHSTVGIVTENGLQVGSELLPYNVTKKGKHYVLTDLNGQQTTGLYVAPILKSTTGMPRSIVQPVLPISEEENEYRYADNNKQLPASFQVGSVIKGYDPYSANKVTFEILDINTDTKSMTVKTLQSINCVMDEGVNSCTFPEGATLYAFVDPTVTLYGSEEFPTKFAQYPESYEIGFRMRVV